MILEFKNLSKFFNERCIVNRINFTFKEKGFYALVGDSGCGKTTLLNILSFIDTRYDGEYLIDEINVKTYSEKDLLRLKAMNFGYIFQNFNLLEDDTVSNNITMMLEASTSLNKESKTQKLEEVLNLLDIKKLKNEYVKNLSGGEKQRVAIARAIITSPKVIFCDEPTGSLDSENSKNVFEILKKLSSEILIICVTHDEEMANKYSDYLLTFSNYKIIEKSNLSISKTESFPLMKVVDKKSKARLKLPFIFSHFKNKFKVKKVRNLIRNFLLSIALITTGLSLSLTVGIHGAVTQAFSEVIDQNTVVMTKKGSKNAIYDYYSSGKEDIVRLLNNYKDYLDYYGANYIVDFENHFIDENDLYLLKKGHIVKIDGFNARHFNEFIYTKEIDKLDTFPMLEKELRNDEIVISINYEQMKNLCLNLKILRSFEELGKHLETHDVMVSLRVRNDSWQYSDEQVWRLKGVIMDTSNRIYHTNPLFNEIVFEENMRFPVTSKLEGKLEMPWTLRKAYYVHTSNFQTYFLNNILYDERYKNFVFDSDNSLYSPLTCPYNSKSTNKLYVFNVFSDSIDLSKIKLLDEYGFKFDSYYFSSNLGYFNNGTSIFSGFARPVFISTKESKIDQIIDAHSKVTPKDFLNITAPEGVVDGYAFKPKSNNLRLKRSREELRPNEIIVSKGFQNILCEEEIIGKEAYVTLLKSSEENENVVKNNFETIKLKIVDVIDKDTTVSIYQNKEFSISLFRDFFKISALNLIPNSVVFETPTKTSQDKLEQLSILMPEYEFQNPILQIEKSIEESTLFLKYILVAFSAVSIVSSLILMLIISLINAIEERKEIAILKVMGFSKFEILKNFMFDNILNSLICYALSMSSLLFMTKFIAKFLKTSVGINELSLLSPLSALVNIILVVLVSIVASFGAYFEIKNIKLSENLH